MTDNIYIGITIGPIYDTLRLSSTPSALWASSYLFSYAAKRICDKIISQISDDENLIKSPCIDGNISKGIGLFHDRIIFETNNPKSDIDTVNNIFDEVKNEIAFLFGDDDQAITWIKNYLQFHAVAFKCEDEKPISESAKFLDGIELERTFPEKSKANPFTELFESAKRNTLIRKNIKDGLSLNTWPFADFKNYTRDKKGGIIYKTTEDVYKTDNNGNRIPEQETMPDMATITGRHHETDTKVKTRQKTYSYYAIVQADGDKMGIHLDEPDFSQKLLRYCSKSSEEIQNYGGITIYAGGDDLLFIAPLWEQPNNDDKLERKNIFELLNALKLLFQENFKGENAPTISFGVAVRYYKYPLYEAFDEANELLFEKAKLKRDSLAVSLRKHSGQSIEFIFEQCSKSADETAWTRISKMITEKKDGNFLKSVSTKIWQFQPLFEHALSLKNLSAVKNVFTNTFDKTIHAQNKDYLNEVAELLNSFDASPVREIGGIAKLEKEIERSKNDKLKINSLTEETKKLYTLDALLRFVKLFSEVGEEEHQNEFEN